MTRYYLLATIIVVLVGALVVRPRPAPDLRIVAAATGTPSAGRDEGAASAPPAAPFAAQGSWVLSGLPACFDERLRLRGSAAALAHDLPPEAARIVPPAAVTAGDCTLEVRAHDLIVRRGADRLRVPPEARLYRVAGRLVLVVRTGDTVELRAY